MTLFQRFLALSTFKKILFIWITASFLYVPFVIARDKEDRAKLEQVYSQMTPEQKKEWQMQQYCKHNQDACIKMRNDEARMQRLLESTRQ